MEMVNLGCRLPSGVTLEVGYRANEKAQGGAPFARYVKLPTYTSHTIKGTNQHLLVRDPGTRKVITLPSRRNSQPFINQVPKEFWDLWNKEHPNNWFVTSGNLYVIPKTDEETVEAVTIDASAKSQPIFQPLDPLSVLDLDGTKIEKRTDE